MKRKKSGMTLVEVIVAMALLGIMSVSLIGGFPSQLVNINKGRDITVQALDEQAGFEDVIYNVKNMIKGHNPGDSLDPLLSAVPEWDYETVQILGENVVMQKITRTYADVDKDNTIYLSRRLAEKEKYDKLPMSGVMIDVSTDTNNEVADLSLSPLPELTAVHVDNTNEPDFYVNLYRWWRSNPGKDLSSLIFPDDFTMLSISQTTDVLRNLLDNVGAGRYVALTVTPVDINGHRGNSMLSSNYVFIKGAEWRVDPSPWADTNNNYNLDSTDVIINTERIQEPLDATYDSIPDQLNPSLMLSIQDSSLFVPMKIDSGGGSIPGDIPVEITGTEVIDWTFENNINIAKDFEVLNGTDVNIRAGSAGDGGSIYLYPYIELDASGNPVTVGGVPQIINYGASISTDGNIYLKTLKRGDIELLNHNGLDGNYINLEARGDIYISNSTLTSDNDIVLDTMKDLAISGDRSIQLYSTFFSSTNPNRKIQLDAGGGVLFKGGGWSSNQTLYLPNGKNILFEKGAARVSNAGDIDVGSTGRMYFRNSMVEDLARSLRIRLNKNSDDSFELTTINYIRNVNYASPSSNQQVALAGLWTRLGTGTQNFEFSTRVVEDGPGDVADLEYSFEGSGIIRINVVETDETAETKIKFDVRDRYNNEIVGSGYFVYSVDAWGNPSIEVEEPPPLNYYTITFNTNGGTEIGPRGGVAGDNVGTVPDPTKTGYNFLGWDKPVPTVIPEYDLELNAIWQPITYTISFTSGWTGHINSLYYKYEDDVYIPNPSRPGYTFYGWDSTPPATMPAENLHFTATWTQKELIVSFNANGGTSPVPVTKTVYYDSPYGPLATTSMTGFTFMGWYTGSSNGTLVESTTIVQNDNNHSLYAHWSGNAYTVTFDSNGGSTPNPGSKTVAFGGTYGTLPTVNRDNHTFDGWFTAQTGGTQITSGSTVTTAGNHVLYAHWTATGGGGPSCPFVYSFDGEDYHFEHESIPYTISSSLETTSYGTLRKLEPVDGIYKVRITEELDEKSFVNGFSLYAVDYPKDLGIKYVKADIFGNPHTVMDKQDPLSMEEKVTGRDVLYNIKTDGVLTSTDFRQMNTKDFMTRYEVKFEKPSNEAETGKFMITAQSSPYASMLGQYYWDKIEAKTHFWWMDRLLNLPGIRNQAQDFMKVVMMTVEVWDGKQWIEQGNIKAGRELMEELLIPIDLSLIDSNTDEVIIRLSHGAGLFDIETVSMDYSINQIDSVKELKAYSALFNGETDVYTDLNNHKDNKRIKMVKGDRIDLEYAVPELDKNMNRGYYVSLSGYYYMDPDVREVSDITIDNKSIVGKVKSIFDAFMEINKDNISMVKWILGLVKDSYKKPLDEKIELMIKSQYDELWEFIENKK